MLPTVGSVNGILKGIKCLVLSSTRWNTAKGLEQQGSSLGGHCRSRRVRTSGLRPNDIPFLPTSMAAQVHAHRPMIISLHPLSKGRAQTSIADPISVVPKLLSTKNRQFISISRKILTYMSSNSMQTSRQAMCMIYNWWRMRGVLIIYNLKFKYFSITTCCLE